MIEKCGNKEIVSSDKRDFQREFEEYIKDFSDLNYTYDLGFSDNCRIDNTYSKNDLENNLLLVGGDVSKRNVGGMDIGKLRRYWLEM